MNIHEYQARELFEKFGVATSKGRVATTPDEASPLHAILGPQRSSSRRRSTPAAAARERSRTASKAACIFATTPEEARDIAAKMLGQTLVTHQTGPDGKLVSKVLVAEAVDIARELYFAILLDRASSAPVIIASTEGRHGHRSGGARTRRRKSFANPFIPRSACSHTRRASSPRRSA